MYLLYLESWKANVRSRGKSKVYTNAMLKANTSADEEEQKENEP